MTEQSNAVKEKTAAASVTAGKEKERGPMYWLTFNLWKHCSNFFQGVGAKISKRPLRWAAYVLLALLLLVYLRPAYSHLLLDVRKYSGTLILIGGFLGIMFVLAARMMREKWQGALPLLVGIAATSVGVYWAGSIHEYLALFQRYRSMHMVDAARLPVTANERIQPLSSIETAARDVMNNTEDPTPVDFVRDPNGSYRIVMGVEPQHPWSKAFGTVDEILTMPGTSPSVAFSKEYREKVSFLVGERLWLDHNSHNCVVRSFGPWGLFNYEPSNAIYMKDDKGEWIQVVTLIRWKGIFFPRPEFGGVQIIRQQKESIGTWFARRFTGCGVWVPPEKVHRYSYLRGQSLVSPVVSRFMADSFRFQDGFLSPMPYYHYGDIRVPDMAEEVAVQPFVAFFKFDDEKAGKLYHYFALEPYDEDKRGLATSVFVPADGIGKVRVYNHAARGESLVGTSAVAGIVRNTRKDYDWEHNIPVEHWPYIRDIGGERRLLFRTAIISMTKEDGKRHIAGTVPEIALTDPVRNTVTWVDPYHPEKWVATLERTMREAQGNRTTP